MSSQSIKSFLQQPKTITCIAIFFISFIIYSSATATQATNIADSNELITAAFTRGLAHPPGYPFYTFLLFLIMKLPFITNPVHLAHLSSAFFQSLNLCIFFILSLQLVQSVFPKIKACFSYWISLLSTSLLAFSYFFFDSATYAEVFPLSIFFAGLLLWLILNHKPKFTYLTWALFGFAIAHHQTILFLLPAYIFILIKKPRRQPWFSSILIFILFLFLPYLLIFTFHQHQAPLSWQFHSSIEGVIDLISRSVYAKNTAPNPSLNPSTSPTIIYSITSLFQYTTSLFWYFGILLAGLGLYFLYRHQKSTFLVIFSSLIIAGPLFAAYIKFPLLDPTNPQFFHYTIALSLRLFQLFFYLLTLTIPISIAGIISLIVNRINSKFAALFLILISIIPFILILDNYSHINKTQDNFDSKLSRQILETLPQDSLLIVDNDYSFALIQSQIMSETRPDILILPTALHMRWGYLQDFLPSHIFTIDGYYRLILALTQWGIEQDRPIFVFDPRPQFIDQMNVFSYYLTPYGHTLQVSLQPTNSPEYDYSLSNELLSKPQHPHNYWHQFLLSKFITIQSNLNEQNSENKHDQVDK